jgi:adenosine deaminase
MTPASIAVIDLHRHTDGSIRPQTILELAEQHDLPLPRDLETLRPLVQVTEPVADLMAFLARMDRAVSALADLAACARVAYECVEDAGREGVIYLETRFSPAYMAQAHNLDVNGVVEAVADGARRGARDSGVRVNLIGIMSRTFGVESCTRELEALLAHRGGFVALDLAGDEAHVPGELSSNTSGADARRAGASRSTRVRRRARRASGRRCAIWAPNALDTEPARRRTRLCSTCSRKSASALSRA